MRWFEVLGVSHRSDGVVVQIQSCHGTAGDPPCSCVLSANGFEMGFEQSERFFWCSLFDVSGGLFHEFVNVDFGFFFLDHRLGCWLGSRFNLFHDVLLSHNHLGRTLKFFHGERGVFIVVVMDRFVEQIFRIFYPRFFSHLFHHGHVDGLCHFNRRLHGFHGDGDAAVFASCLKRNEGGVSGEKTEGAFRHVVSTFEVANSLQKDGEVGGRRCMLLIEVKADLEGLSRPSGVLLCFQQNASVEPRHVARRIQSDGFVEGGERALDIGTTTAFFTHREQNFDHFLGVVHVFKFGNDVPGCR